MCDVATAKKIEFFYQLTPDLDGFWFLPHTECAVNKKKFEARAKLKSWWWLLLSPYVCLQCLFRKKFKFWFFYECLKSLGRINFFSTHSVGVD
jgi:hypothetical protein